MTSRAWIYITSVITGGLLITGLLMTMPAPPMSQGLIFGVLTILAVVAQLFEAEAPGRQSYYPHLVFFFAGLLLLHPILFVLLVAIPHLVEWAHKRMTSSPYLRAWYIQPFNIATHITAGFVAHWVIVSFDPTMSLIRTPVSVLAVCSGALTYVFFNHTLVGLVLTLARGVTLRESDILSLQNTSADLILVLLGYIVAVLWVLNPWLALLALTPLILIHRALAVPQLKKDAQTDEKTGLWNARHWNHLYTTEFDRSRRFDRPLALIMADLDLLRNINNTYGHLAGDAVLAGVGEIIRQSIRSYDIAGRFGGEEFAIVLPETDLLEAKRIAERVRSAVEHADFVVDTSPTPIRATISIGLACFPNDALEANLLIHQADVVLYQAKLRGRNCVASAPEVPRSFTLSQAAPDAAGVRPDGLAPLPNADVTPAAASTPPAPKHKPEVPAASAQPAHGLRSRITLEVYATTLFGLALAMALHVFVIAHAPVDWLTIGLLMASAVMAELFPVNVYKFNTISVSMAINFAAALIGGIAAVMCVSAAIVLVHYVRMQPRLYKVGFNWATHIAAGLAPVIITQATGIPLTIINLPLLVIPLCIAALAYYGLDTGLIAIAIALQNRSQATVVWRQQFRWLAEHYMVLCLMGVFLAIADTALGPQGILVFIMPVFMMRYAQKQYVERTEASMEELRRMNDELATANREVMSASQSINQLNDELFLTLAQICDARDPYVGGHAAKVAEYAMATAVEMGIPADDWPRLRQAAYLHDIGKISIPDSILRKPARLTPLEYEIIKMHATQGGEILETSHGLRHLAPLVRHHHERWDGTGYPNGLAGEQIPLEARILSVCDAVEAMASDRPYHKAMPVEEIIAELKRNAGSQFDPQVVEIFVRIAERDGVALITNSVVSVNERKSAKMPANGLLWYGTLNGTPAAASEDRLMAALSLGLAQSACS